MTCRAAYNKIDTSMAEFLAPVDVEYLPRPGPRRLVQAHVWIMLSTYSVVFPAGIFAAVLIKGPRRYWAHACIQCSGLLLTAAGIGIAIYKFEALLKPTWHANVGCVFLVFLVLHIVVSVLRPPPETSWRKLWFMVHQIFGVLVLLGGFACNVTGFMAYKAKHGDGLDWAIVPYVAYSAVTLLLYVYVARISKHKT